MAKPEAKDEEQIRDELVMKPTSPGLNFKLMEVLLDKGRTEEALVYGLRALQHGKPRPALLIDLMALCEEHKLTWLSSAVAEKALADGLRTEQLYAQVARARLAQGDPDTARRLLDEAREHHPDSRVLNVLRESLPVRDEPAQPTPPPAPPPAPQIDRPRRMPRFVRRLRKWIRSRRGR